MAFLRAQRPRLAGALLAGLLVFAAMAPAVAQDESAATGPVALARLDVRGPWQLDGLEIKGVPTFRAWLMRSGLQTRPAPWWDFWTADPEFVPGYLESDAESVRRQLENDGYYQARVRAQVHVLARPRRTVDPPQPGRVVALLDIERGAAVLVCSLFIDFEEAAMTPEEQERLRRMLPLVVGARFTQAEYAATSRMLQRHFNQRGYPQVVVVKQARVDTRVGCAEVAYQVGEGEVGFFGATTMELPENISREVVARQIAYKEGELYSQKKVEDTISRLRAMGLFSVVRLAAAPSKRDHTVPMDLDLQTGPSRELRLGVGYGTDDGIRGIASWWDYNFFGEARQLGFSAKVSQVNSAIDASFVQPHLFFENSRAAASLTIGRDDESTYIDDYLKVTPRLTWGITDEWAARVSWQSRYDTLAGVSETTIDDLGRDNYVNSGFTNRIGAALSYASLDNNANPTRGFAFDLGGEVAGGALGADFNYYRITAGFSAYRPIWEKLVLSLRIRAGTLIPYGGTRQVPLWARFYAGGTVAYQVRGYARRRVGPLSGSNDPLGGQSVAVASLQLQYPIFGPVWAVGFVDAGDVELSAWTLAPANIQTGVGVGLRAVTPIGPVQLDVGFGLDPTPGDNRLQISFSIGPEF
ncbi:MAG: BamA/TamA family outer membrane protein [Deltaproteobacteria bacterium]